jgi:sugar lactone lactonase YvrE
MSPSSLDVADLEIEVRPVLQARAGLAEGPHWWQEKHLLVWVDIEASTIGLFDPSTGRNRDLPIGSHVGCAVPTASGDLLAATATGFFRVDPRNGDLTPLHHPEQHKPGNRFNDGKCDPWGHFWAGTMAYDFSPGAGALWRLGTDGHSHCARDNLSISNGLAWSLDHRWLYLIDSPTLQVMRIPLAPDGQLAGAASCCVEIPASWNCLPDGMTIDNQGMLWIALFGGGAVTRWNPGNGEHLATLRLPCQQVTSCCFGGPVLDELFITTARRNLTAAELEQEPLAGSLFVAEPGVCGAPARSFAG